MENIQNRSLLYEQTADKALPAGALIPRGVYDGQLVEVLRFSNVWGKRLTFVFEITAGEHAGDRVTLSTSRTLSRYSKLGQTVAALLGRELMEDELLYGYKPDNLKGVTCRLVLGRAATKAGKPYTTVENILT